MATRRGSWDGDMIVQPLKLKNTKAGFGIQTIDPAFTVGNLVNWSSYHKLEPVNVDYLNAHTKCDLTSNSIIFIPHGRSVTDSSLEIYLVNQKN